MSKTTPRKNSTSLTTYADVSPAIPIKTNQERLYTYSVPAKFREKISLYSQVLVPFGPRRVSGTVMQIHHCSKIHHTKAIVRVSNNALTTRQIKFARWIADTTHGGLGFTARLFQPPNPFSSPKPFAQNSDDAQLPKNKNTNTPNNKYLAVIEKDTPVRAEKIKSIILDYLKKNKRSQAFVLVPEKWMIEKTYKSLFPDKYKQIIITSDKTSSYLSSGWQSIKKSDTKIIIGTQKSLFAPFSNLDLIVIEEDFFPAHKLWDQYPRLDNFYAAKELALIYNCPLVISSSFLSLRAEYLLKKNKLYLLKNNPVQPKVSITNLTPMDRSSKKIVPDDISSQLKKWIKERETILIYYNRRGSWQTVGCRSCQRILRCPNCFVSLNLHSRFFKNKKKEPQTKQFLLCHHCGYSRKMPSCCPKCKRGTLFVSKMGGQRIIQEIKKISGPKILMIDAATLKNKNNLNRDNKLSGKVVFGTSAVHLFIENQKFERILWLFPEIDILYPDFRSVERAYYNLVRLQKHLSNQKKKVFVVTRQPTVIEKRLAPPPDDFVHQQLKERKKYYYPPYADLVKLTFTANKEEDALKKAQKNLHKIQQQASSSTKDKSADETITIRGPFISFVKRRKKKYEAHITISGPLKKLTPLYKKTEADTVDLAPERLL